LKAQLIQSRNSRFSLPDPLSVWILGTPPTLPLVIEQNRTVFPCSISMRVRRPRREQSSSGVQQYHVTTLSEANGRCPSPHPSLPPIQLSVIPPVTNVLLLVNPTTQGRIFLEPHRPSCSGVEAYHATLNLSRANSRFLDVHVVILTLHRFNHQSSGIPLATNRQKSSDSTIGQPSGSGCGRFWQRSCFRSIAECSLRFSVQTNRRAPY